MITDPDTAEQGTHYFFMFRISLFAMDTEGDDYLDLFIRYAGPIQTFDQ